MSLLSVFLERDTLCAALSLQGALMLLCVATRRVFLVEFNEAIKTSHVRLYVRDVTYGGTANWLDNNATNGAINGGDHSHKLVLREIEIYGA